ncbi:MAG: Ku protein [Gemmatimonadaceae bacterium]
MARSIWKGTMGFGLVTIGVELLTAERAEELDLDLLDKRDHARIGYQKYNKSTGDIVQQADIVRGFEVSEGKYVVLTNEDLKAANPKATQSVDIVGFVPQEDIPLLFYAKPYYVSPLKGSDKAYALLRDALADSKQVGIAQIVIHTRQHVAAVYPYEGVIVVQLLRYAHELKEPDDAGVKDVPHNSKNSRAPEFTMAKQLIDSMVSAWKPEQFKDTYKDDVLKLIHQRAKKGGGKTSPAVNVPAASETKVLDLVAALRNSLNKPKSQGKTTAKKSIKRAVKPAVKHAATKMAKVKKRKSA